MSASRVVVGNCPECGRIVLVENDYESWPLAQCPCGWASGILDIPHGTLYERGRLPVPLVTPEPVQ